VVQLVLSQLRAQRRRLVRTTVAIVVGVAFLSGALILGDTLSQNFTRLFTDVSAGTDVVVRSSTDLNPNDVIDQRGLIPASTVDEVGRVPGVAHAEGQIAGYGTLLGADGDAIGGNGPPRMAGSWISDPTLNPYELVEGRAPVGDDEVVINRGAAKDGHLRLGSHTTVQTPDPVDVTVVGIATFGHEDGFGTATWTAFSMAGAAAHVAHRTDQVSTVLVKAASGTSSETLRDRVRDELPRGTQAITGAQLAKERIDDVSSSFLGIIRRVLILFALVALGVGGITITNAFSITVAQRTQELALLRAVGASRRQVRRIVRLEALLLGSVGSAIGAAAGLGLAGLLKGMFDAFGFALPAGGLTVRPSAVLIAIAAGLAVTLLAARTPARRAGQVAPVAALRDLGDGVDLPTRRRTAVGVAALSAGVVAGVVGATGRALAPGALAAVGLVTGTLLLAPHAIGPVAGAIGRVLRLTLRQGAGLAEANLRRHPRRSASTATALVVGVAVVSLFTVLAASLKTSLGDQVQGSLRADLTVNTAAFGGGQLSPLAVDALGAVPGVREAVGLGIGVARVDGKATRLTATDLDRVSDVLALDTTAGSLSAVDEDGMAISQTRAEDRGWHVGTTVPVLFPDGTTLSLTVQAIYDDDRLAGGTLLPTSTWLAHNAQPTLRMVLLNADADTSTRVLASRVDPIATRFGGDVQDQAQVSSASTNGIDMILGIVYVLLALAVLVALLGIANALSLAVHERRRELGLLRAIGQTRRQVRRVLRLESVMIASFGTLAGIGLGTFLGWILFEAVSDEGGFTLPVPRLLIVAVVGALAGALAARRPARRAARLPILEAIATT
jgi:putative ABC transport system permease protein